MKKLEDMPRPEAFNVDAMYQFIRAPRYDSLGTMVGCSDGGLVKGVNVVFIPTANKDIPAFGLPGKKTRKFRLSFKEAVRCLRVVEQQREPLPRPAAPVAVAPKSSRPPIPMHIYSQQTKCGTRSMTLTKINNGEYFQFTRSTIVDGKIYSEQMMFMEETAEAVRNMFDVALRDK